MVRSTLTLLALFNVAILFPGKAMSQNSEAETAISGSFQQNLASVYNGVSVWKLIMGWISGYGNH